MLPLRTRILLRALGLVCGWLLFLSGSLADDQPSSATMDVSRGADDTSEAPQKRVLKPAENVDLSDVVVTPSGTLLSTPTDDVEQPGAAQQGTELQADTAVADSPETVLPVSPSSVSPSVSQADEVIAVGEATTPASDLPPADRQQALILLETEVLPGTSTRLAWSPKVSFMGVSAPTPVLVVNGVHPGPTLCLTAAVHGDETNGIETVRRVLYSIDAEELSGAIIGVPIVNLEGFRAGSRYLPDRRDLNRFFPGNQTGSAASRIAFSFFKEVISRCDLLIDLHTGSFGRTNLHQLRADLAAPGVKDLSEQMGRIVVVQSRGARGTLRRAAAEKGIPAVTLEAGAPNELDNAVVEASVKSVENAMSGLGLFNAGKWRPRSDAPVYYKSAWVRASEGGFLISETRLGANVQPDELLGVVTNPITNQRSEIRSPSSGRIIGMSLNQVMQPGYAAYHLGIKPSEDADSQLASKNRGGLNSEGLPTTDPGDAVPQVGVNSDPDATPQTSGSVLDLLLDSLGSVDDAEAGR
ncbi:MAG: succinylglutamate desuccinylase/aspartoacylase family protein [Congregibacter sp.]